MRTLTGLLAVIVVGCGSPANDPVDGQLDEGAGGTSLAADAAVSTGGAKATGGSTGSGGAKAAGGSTGSGGATGSGGTLHTDGGAPCSNLPAAGTWESILPYAVGGADFGAGFSEAISVDPFDPGVLWLGTGAKGIYKSTDCGATFTHMNTGRNASAFEPGNHISMLVDPVDRGVIYVANIHYAINLWKSTNGGVDWDPLFPAGSEVANVVHSSADSVSMDPSDHRHLVVGFHDYCSAPYAPACEAETTDAGATWRIVKQPTTGWEEGAGPWVIDATSWVYAGTSGLWLTADRGASWKDVSPAGAWAFEGGEVETHPIPRLTDGTFLLTSLQGMVKSTDKGRTWTLMPNSGGRVVGFAMGNGLLFNSDQWSGTYHTAKASAPTTWTTLAAPPAPGDQGAPFVDYDTVHHVLYSSNFAGGLWRTVVQ